MKIWFALTSLLIASPTFPMTRTVASKVLKTAKNPRVLLSLGSASLVAGTAALMHKTGLLESGTVLSEQTKPEPNWRTIQIRGEYKPLFNAIIKGKREVVRALLDQGQVDVNTTDEYGMSPLLLATMRGDHEMVKLLIESGADMTDYRPLLAAMIQYDTYCKSESFYEILETLIAHCPDITTLHLPDHDTRIDQSKTAYSELKFMLNQYFGHTHEYREYAFLFFNSRTRKEWYVSTPSTPLDLAWQLSKEYLQICKEKTTRSSFHFALLKLLLDHGAELTPTIRKAILGNATFQTFQFLVEYKAISRKTHLKPALASAIRKGDVPLARVLIEKYHVNPNAKYQGTPFIVLAAEGRFRDRAQIVELLLKHGADPDATDKQGRTALMTAAANGRDDIFTKLVGHANKDLVDERGLNALSHAMLRNNTKIAEQLT